MGSFLLSLDAPLMSAHPLHIDVVGHGSEISLSPPKLEKVSVLMRDARPRMRRKRSGECGRSGLPDQARRGMARNVSPRP
jgi:hypothetical protein